MAKKNLVVLTGAGISAESGLKTFRDSDGLWEGYDVREVATPGAWYKNPQLVLAFYNMRRKNVADAKPNAAHFGLAELENKFDVTIITQNIDGLHQKAGSKHVAEMHGTLRTLTCTNCFKQFESSPFLGPYIETGKIPQCLNCNGILKPDVILFGEQLPQSAWVEAQRAARQCDLMIVAGSSLEVLPVAGLPMQALDRGAHLIIINNTPTYLNVRADIILMGDVATTIPEIAKRVFHG